MTPENSVRTHKKRNVKYTGVWFLFIISSSVVFYLSLLVHVEYSCFMISQHGTHGVYGVLAVRPVVVELDLEQGLALYLIHVLETQQKVVHVPLKAVVSNHRRPTITLWNEMLPCKVIWYTIIFRIFAIQLFDVGRKTLDINLRCRINPRPTKLFL